MQLDQKETGTGSKFRTLKNMALFQEPQMRIGKPVYFSPDFHHRLYVDKLSKTVKVEYTLNPGGLNIAAEFNIKKQLMYAKTKNEPMIYFHANDKIAYLSHIGVEKLFLLEMNKPGSSSRRRHYKVREIANISYSEKEMVRRILYDQFHYKKELTS